MIHETTTEQHPLNNNQPKPSNNKHSDITRPTLKRLTAEQHAKTQQQQQQQQPPPPSNQIWFTKPLQSSPSKGKQPDHTQDTITKTPLAHNPNRIKGDRDVLIHHVEKNHTLAGIALSYGISLPALRKANGMWPSDPLTIKTTLRIPLGLCNLPPSKKIEIEQDSGKVLVWEHHPPSSSSSNPSSTTIHPTSEHALLLHQNNHQASNSNLLDCASSSCSDSSASAHPHQKHLSISSCTSSSPYPQQQPLPYAQLGQLAPISNSGSPPPSPQPTVASLEKVPAHQLGFFTTTTTTTTTIQQQQLEANVPNPQTTPPRQTRRERQIPDALPIPSSRTSTSMAPSTSSTSNLRQRSTNLSNPSQLASSSISPSPKPPLPISIPPINTDPHAFPHYDQPQISPDSQKKLTSQIHLFSHSRIPRVSSHHDTSGDGLPEPMGGSLSKGTGSSKWTTVRPGRPPPLHRQLKFLEERATQGSNKVGTALSNAIEGLFRGPVPPPTPPLLQRPSADDSLHHSPLVDQSSSSLPACDASLWSVWNHLFQPNNPPLSDRPPDPNPPSSHHSSLQK